MVNSNISREDLEKLIRDNSIYQRNELLKSTNQKDYYPNNRIKKFEEPEEKDVFEAGDYWFRNHEGSGTTFGVTFTYGGKIVILDRLKGEDRKTVLQHELHHRHNPADSEYMTRKKTGTEEFSPNPTVSPIGGYNG